MRAEDADVLGQHLLLARRSRRRRARRRRARFRIQAEQVARASALVRNGVWRAGADVQSAVPSSQAMEQCVSRCACWARLRRVGRLVDRRRPRRSRARRRRRRRGARQDVAARALDPATRVPLSVHHRCAGPHRLLGVEDGGQHLVLHLQPPAALLGGSSVSATTAATRCPTKRDHVVQDVGVVGVDARIIVARRGVQLPRHVLPGEHRVHAGHRQRRAPCRWRRSARARAASAAA